MRIIFILPPSLVALLVLSLLSVNVEANGGVWKRKFLSSRGDGAGYNGSGSDASSGDKNLVIKMGSSSIDAPGSQCSWDDVSSKPVITFPQAEENQTYTAMAMQLSLNFTSLDALTTMSSSNVYASYIHSGLRATSTKSPVLISDINPLVPFQMTGQETRRPQMLIVLLYAQLHPLFINDNFLQAFVAMKTDASTRQSFNFEAFCESAAISDFQAATWVVVNGTLGADSRTGSFDGAVPETKRTGNPTATQTLGGGTTEFEGSIGQRLTSITSTDTNGELLALTSDLPATSNAGNSSVAIIATTDVASEQTTFGSSTSAVDSSSGDSVETTISESPKIAVASTATFVSTTLLEGAAKVSCEASGGGTVAATVTVTVHGNGCVVETSMPGEDKGSESATNAAATTGTTFGNGIVSTPTPTADAGAGAQGSGGDCGVSGGESVSKCSGGSSRGGAPKTSILGTPSLALSSDKGICNQCTSLNTSTFTTSSMPTTTGPGATKTILRLTAIYPIPSSKCAFCSDHTASGMAAGTGSVGFGTGTGGLPAPSSGPFPVIVSGAMVVSAPGSFTAFLLSGVGFLFFVLL